MDQCVSVDCRASQIGIVPLSMTFFQYYGFLRKPLSFFSALSSDNEDLIEFAVRKKRQLNVMASILESNLAEIPVLCQTGLSYPVLTPMFSGLQRPETITDFMYMFKTTYNICIPSNIFYILSPIVSQSTGCGVTKQICQ